MKLVVSTTLAALISSAAFAEAIKLTPADPQPKGLTPGLAVSYAYGAGGRTLEEAQGKLTKAKPGPALAGLSYLDSNEGDNTLTADEPFKVAAAISGYIRFDTPGTFEINFFSNDGLNASIGGKQVAMADEVRGCEPTGVKEVEVPVAGWYALEATYFQRKGTACLMMDWSVSGEMEPVPDAVFGH